MLFIENNRYKIFSYYSEVYEKDKECRKFIWSHKPPIILPIIIIKDFDNICLY